MWCHYCCPVIRLHREANGLYTYILIINNTVGRNATTVSLEVNGLVDLDQYLCSGVSQTEYLATNYRYLWPVCNQQHKAQTTENNSHILLDKTGNPGKQRRLRQMVAVHEFQIYCHLKPTKAVIAFSSKPWSQGFEKLMICWQVDHERRVEAIIYLLKESINNYVHGQWS